MILEAAWLSPQTLNDRIKLMTSVPLVNRAWLIIFSYLSSRDIYIVTLPYINHLLEEDKEETLLSRRFRFSRYFSAKFCRSIKYCDPLTPRDDPSERFFESYPEPDPSHLKLIREAFRTAMLSRSLSDKQQDPGFKRQTRSDCVTDINRCCIMFKYPWNPDHPMIPWHRRALSLMHLARELQPDILDGFERTEDIDQNSMTFALSVHSAAWDLFDIFNVVGEKGLHQHQTWTCLFIPWWFAFRSHAVSAMLSIVAFIQMALALVWSAFEAGLDPYSLGCDFGADEGLPDECLVPHLPNELIERIITEAWLSPLTLDDRILLMTSVLVSRAWLATYFQVSFRDIYVPTSSYASYLLDFHAGLTPLTSCFPDFVTMPSILCRSLKVRCPGDESDEQPCYVDCPVPHIAFVRLITQWMDPAPAWMSDDSKHLHYSEQRMELEQWCDYFAVFSKCQACGHCNECTKFKMDPMGWILFEEKEALKTLANP